MVKWRRTANLGRHMKNAITSLNFTVDFLQWQRAKKQTYQEYGPQEYLEECILKEKAEAFDRMWDLLHEGAEDAEILEVLKSYE